MRSPDRPLAPRDVVASGLCIGCGGCASGGEAAMRWDRYGQLKPAGPPAWERTRTAAFARTCPFSPAARNEDEIAAERFPAAAQIDARVGRFEAAYVGAAAEDGFREAGSSGGMVSWVAAELMRAGLVDAVVHVAEADSPARDGRYFGYRVSRSLAELRAGAKSRYYPVELSGALREIRATPGRYAIVGVPCFIKAVHLLRAEDPLLAERIAFTLGLYCGHMKSARMVESFGWQMGVGAGEIERIDFRVKDASRPANWYTAQVTRPDGSRERRDWWHLADGDWGAGFFMNPACNFCDDVVAETADISFGDAWVEPYSSDGRGTNVVVVRAPALHRMLEAAIAARRLDLAPVDAEFVVATQAAGFRQRREGLAYRLAHRRFGLRPVKRVAPRAAGIPFRRRLIYAMRRAITAGSHAMFRLARLTRRPRLYLGWARGALALYHGLAYSRGRFGAWLDRVEGWLAPVKPS